MHQTKRFQSQLLFRKSYKPIRIPRVRVDPTRFLRAYRYGREIRIYQENAPSS